MCGQVKVVVKIESQDDMLVLQVSIFFSSLFRHLLMCSFHISSEVIILDEFSCVDTHRSFLTRMIN